MTLNPRASPILASPSDVEAKGSAFVHLHQTGGAGAGEGAEAAAAPSYLMLVPAMVAALRVRLEESRGSVDMVDHTEQEAGLGMLGLQAAEFGGPRWHTLATAGHRPAVRTAVAAGLGSHCLGGNPDCRREPEGNPGCSCSCTLRSSLPTEKKPERSTQTGWREILIKLDTGISHLSTRKKKTAH